MSMRGPTTKPRTAAVTAGVALLLALPASAAAARLAVDEPCYGPGQPIAVTGSGFTPSGDVSLSVSGQQLGIGAADREGAFGTRLTAPSIARGQRRYVFSATDQTDRAITADAPVLVSALAVVMRPQRGKPNALRSIRVRGFTRGKSMFAHIRRPGFRRDLRIARLKGPCGRARARRRLFPPDARPGVYRVQFDARRRYSKRTRPSVSFLMAVFPRLR